MQCSQSCSASFLGLASKWILKWSRNLQWDLLPQSDAPSLSWTAAPYQASPSVELPYVFCLFHLDSGFAWLLSALLDFWSSCLLPNSIVLYRSLLPVWAGSGYLHVTGSFLLFLSYFWNNELNTNKTFWYFMWTQVWNSLNFCLKWWNDFKLLYIPPLGHLVPRNALGNRVRLLQLLLIDLLSADIQIKIS